MSKVLITGASGMIGSLILSRALNDASVEEVISLVRQKSGVKNKKLTEVVVKNFEVLSEVEKFLNNVDVVYYCIGVYTGAVKEDLFKKITVTYPKVLAEKIKEFSPNARFCLLSGAGADRREKSKIAFARYKGEVENILDGFFSKNFYTFRPSYIYPVTKRVEPNFSYKLWYLLYPLLKLFGDKVSIKSTELADGMYKIGQLGSQQNIFENKEIINLLK